MYKLHELEKPILFGNTGRLHYISAHRFEKDWKKGTEHSHQISELFFCIGGKGVFSVQGKQLPVSFMDFIIIDPYVMHTEWSSKDSPMEYICLGLSGFQLTPAVDNNGIDGYYFGSFQDAQDLILTGLSTLVAEVSDPQKGFEEVCSHIMSVLLLYLKRKNTLVDASRSPSVPSENHTIVWVHQYLTDNYTKEINLDALADKVNINKYSLIRSFQKVYGVTPIEYALSLRFSEAKMLLKNTDHPIFQIAFHLGFSSSNYFSQCFQRREGISPTAFRLRSRRIGT